MGLTDVMAWASGTDLLPDTPASASSPAGHRTLAQLSRAGELAAGASPAKAFVTPGGGRGPRAGDITPHSSEYEDLQRAIEAAEIASKHTPKTAKSKQSQLEGSTSLAFTPAAPAAFGSPASATAELRERKTEMHQLLEAGAITPAEYTKMVGGLRAEAALTPAKHTPAAPPVEPADVESAASPVFTVGDTMTEVELAALAAERAEVQSEAEAQKKLPSFSGSPATAIAVAIESGLGTAAAVRKQQEEQEQERQQQQACGAESKQLSFVESAAVSTTMDDSSFTTELKGGFLAGITADTSSFTPELTVPTTGTAADMPATPVPQKHAVQDQPEKSPASAKADGILARWHKWDLDFAQDYMARTMELDDLRQLALEFGPYHPRI